jgi:hypothetical protein
VNAYFKELQTQRWDDHRYYHHSRINQSLHLISAVSFLTAYVLLVVNPPLAAWVAWCVSMTSRQAGHFFFEPRGYDHVNQASDAHKEAIKIGYNIQRKIVLMAIWVVLPALLWRQPALGEAMNQWLPAPTWFDQVGWSWLLLGIGGLVFRVLQLWVQRDLVTGLVWAVKIMTDPFHDAMLYRKAPFYLLKGQLIDPMLHVQEKH